MVGEIATWAVEEEVDHATSKPERGSVGGKALALHLSKSKRSRIAKAVAEARWKERSEKMNDKADDSLSGLLFGQDEPKLVNLKLLRGDASNVTDDELKAEAHSAIAQVRLGRSTMCKDFPDGNANIRIDMNDLASKL